MGYNAVAVWKESDVYRPILLAYCLASSSNLNMEGMCSSEFHGVTTQKTVYYKDSSYDVVTLNKIQHKIICKCAVVCYLQCSLLCNNVSSVYECVLSAVNEHEDQ
jgi:hypothetical protein